MATFPDGHPAVHDLFAKVTQVAQLQRKRGPLVIETYALNLLSGPKGDVFDHSPPPELAP